MVGILRTKAAWAISGFRNTRRRNPRYPFSAGRRGLCFLRGMSGTSAWQALVRLSVYCSIHKSLHHDSAEIVPFSVIVMPGRYLNCSTNSADWICLFTVGSIVLDEEVVLRLTQRLRFENYYSNSLGMSGAVEKDRLFLRRNCSLINAHIGFAHTQSQC